MRFICLLPWQIIYSPHPFFFSITINLFLFPLSETKQMKMDMMQYMKMHYFLVMKDTKMDMMQSRPCIIILDCSATSELNQLKQVARKVTLLVLVFQVSLHKLVCSYLGKICFLFVILSEWGLSRDIRCINDYDNWWGNTYLRPGG